jgi:HD-like signal output (HDOD) protein
VTARIVARSTAPEHSGEAFVAGLLHDIGCGLLMLVDAEKYIELTQRRAAQAGANEILDTATELQEEKRLFGVTQWEATHTLAERWKLPEWLGESLSRDGRPVTPSVASRPLIDAVRWAERIAGELGYPNVFQAGMLIHAESEAALPDSLRIKIVDEAPAQIDDLGSALTG